MCGFCLYSKHKAGVKDLFVQLILGVLCFFVSQWGVFWFFWVLGV